MVGARLERAGDRFLPQTRRAADGGLDDLPPHRHCADASRTVAYSPPMKSLAVAVAAFAALSAQTGGADVTFTAHEIATGLRGGYQVVVADLNKDGKPDI